jgi:hypothetical protein
MIATGTTPSAAASASVAEATEPGLAAWAIATMAIAWFGTGAAIEDVSLDVAEKQVAALENR